MRYSCCEILPMFAASALTCVGATTKPFSGLSSLATVDSLSCGPPPARIHPHASFARSNGSVISSIRCVMSSSRFAALASPCAAAVQNAISFLHLCASSSHVSSAEACIRWQWHSSRRSVHLGCMIHADLKTACLHVLMSLSCCRRHFHAPSRPFTSKVPFSSARSLLSCSTTSAASIISVSARRSHSALVPPAFSARVITPRVNAAHLLLSCSFQPFIRGRVARCSARTSSTSRTP